MATEMPSYKYERKLKILRICKISLASSPLGRISFSNEEFESFATVLG